MHDLQFYMKWWNLLHSLPLIEQFELSYGWNLITFNMFFFDVLSFFQLIWNLYNQDCQAFSFSLHLSLFRMGAKKNEEVICNFVKWNCKGAKIIMYLPSQSPLSQVSWALLQSYPDPGIDQFIQTPFYFT